MTPLRSCPICAKWVTVEPGFETKRNPCCGAGVNGGLVAGVATVTSMVVEAFWTKFALKPGPLKESRAVRLPGPFQ